MGSLREQFESRGLMAGNSFALGMSAQGTSQAGLEIHLYPGGEAYSERGMMRAQNGVVKQSIRLADKGNWLSRALQGGLKRIIVKEDYFTAQFDNKSGSVASVELTPEKYSGLFALNLGNTPSGTLYCRPGSWVLSGPDNATSFKFFRNLLSPSVWAGKKPKLEEKITGTDIVVIGSPQAPLRGVDVKAGESLMVDCKDLYGYTHMDHSLAVTSWNLGTIVMGKEDRLNIRFTGPGTVILRQPG